MSLIDQRHPAGLSRFRSLILVSAALAASCSGGLEGDTTGAGGADAREAGQSDVPADLTPEAPGDAMDERSCTPFERRDDCTSPLTGCPSYQECKNDGTAYYCLCNDCRLELGLGECSWTFQGPDLAGTDETTSVAVPPPGGGIEAVLPEWPSESACAASPGWYAEQTASTLTVHLCPASCSEHLANPETVFLVARFACPIE